MTAMPEAKLAREAELPYALVGMVTDYDCWRDGDEPVEVPTIDRPARRPMPARRAAWWSSSPRLLPPERAPSPIDTIWTPR